MKNYIQHGNITTYDHCVRVARMSYMLGEALRLKVSHKELIRAAFLHDYFLYDWHSDYSTSCDPDRSLPLRLFQRYQSLHGFTHPRTAMENARRDFDLTDKEAQIIRSHMWPLTIMHPPKSKEAFLVCCADKIVSLHETIAMRK
ncbi:HD domain-containing protein [Butyrivibrio sp. MC2013]|uniref:HD domain-containing protein n=1 Tax=Butyrivibrio sp. MC2013 TaxID=1280686 RepID=UPI0003F532C9|nr:HD domain-containing protein [Butyrivibrio sp. MC2013]